MGDALKGKVAVVTGSGQGIGRSIAIGMAVEGAKVVTNNRKRGSTGNAILGDSQIKSLEPEKKEWFEKGTREISGDAETTAQAIRESGGEAVPFFGDISDFNVAAQLIQAAADAFGRIDILVNVAGTFGFSPIWEITEETWDRVTRTKPKGYFNTIRHAAPYMMKQKWGRILNCTSRAFAGDVIKHAEYVTANAGVNGLTKAASKELRPFGITCNAFAPHAKTRASFELEAYDLAVSKEESPWLDRKLAKKVAAAPDPDDVVPFLIFLCTEEAAAISGSVFFVGGNDISLYSEVVNERSLTKSGSRWTVEELMQEAPRALFTGYRSPARIERLLDPVEQG
jgi:3-oxoacyl-[acyl-carrier protein] reductase